MSDGAFEALLERVDRPHGGGPKLGVAELAATRARAESVTLPDAVRGALVELRAFLATHSVDVSDRRWVRIVRALRIAALANGRREVALDDLCLLRFLVCDRAQQLELVDDWCATLLGAGQSIDPVRITRVVDAFEKQIELEANAAELAFDDSGKLALMQNVGGADREAIAGAAPRMSAFSRLRKYSATHVRARVAQIDAVSAEIDAFVELSDRHSARVLGSLAANLWVDPRFAERVAQTLNRNLERVVAQRNRLRQVRSAFAALPLADTDDGRAPDPIEVDA